MRIIVLVLGLLLSWVAVAAETGQPAPLFRGEPLQGKEAVELERYRGQVVYLDFWASWCGPCRQSLPALEQMRGEYGPAGFEVIAVNLDAAPQDGLDFLEKYPVTYPTVQDSAGNIARLYQVRTMPMSYLIDRRGMVRHVHQGFNKKDLPRLRAAVSELLGEEQP
jgi:thiol-disulfide isomerase/thioredoxin